jgi:hypothetical protein
MDLAITIDVKSVAFGVGVSTMRASVGNSCGLNNHSMSPM